MPEGWPDLARARDHIRELLDPANLMRGYLRGRQLLGWIGGQERYPGHVWELHPLVVHAGHERRGVGRALVADLEERVRSQGIHTMFVGSDDILGQTSLAGLDLYPDVLAHLVRLRDVAGHPFAFYRRLGYSVIGAVPDANGFGRPDIYLAKRLIARE